MPRKHTLFNRLTQIIIQRLPNQTEQYPPLKQLGNHMLSSAIVTQVLSHPNGL